MKWTEKAPGEKKSAATQTPLKTYSSLLLLKWLLTRSRFFRK